MRTEMGHLVWWGDLEKSFPALLWSGRDLYHFLLTDTAFSLACCPSPRWTTETLQKAFPKTSVLRGDKGNQCVDLLGYVKRYSFSLCWHYYVSMVDSHDKLKIPQNPSDSNSANQIIYSELHPFHLSCKYSLCRRASLEPLEECCTVLWASLVELLSCTPFLSA